MKTAIIHSDFNGRIKDKSHAEELANELGADVCHFRYHNNGLECSFGFGIVKDGEILGLTKQDFTWV